MNTLPYAKPIGVYEAKTHFSKIVDDLVNGRCGPVPVLRHGKKAVFIVTDDVLAEKPRPALHFGLGKGRYKIVDDIDEANDEVLGLFAAGEP